MTQRADIAIALRSGDAKVQRFTLDGSDSLEQHLGSVCEEVAKGVLSLIGESRLEGLLLGGGYGRGEGGVLATSTGDQPYNDLEFYVFVRGNRILAERKYRAALHSLGERLSVRAGLEVEFKVLTIKTLRRAGPSMFYHDLVVGHRRIIGGESLLSGCEHHRDPRRIPLHEATRLLMNRCSGLLFSAERLAREEFTSAESDFVGRNLAKAQLAIGDVVLTLHGKYHWSCRERRVRLGDLRRVAREEWLADMLQHHSAGVLFKLRPIRSRATREELAERHRSLVELSRQVWLWLEKTRLNEVFSDTAGYAFCGSDKCPQTKGLRNRLVNARAFGPFAAVKPGATRHPRQRLLHSLCLLLWEKNLLETPVLLRRVQRELGTKASDFRGLVAAYEKLWHRFN